MAATAVARVEGMEFWNAIHSERARLGDLLGELTAEQWATQSLCARWTVEQVTAHLTAAANTGTAAWIFSIVRARFSPGVHNARLLAKYLGDDPAGTLEMYRRSIHLTISPTKDYAAFLGESVVHGQDIARPLGLDLVPDPAAVEEVARFYASKDFTVNSKTLIAGIRLEADDADFASGDGPLVRGPLLDLVMVMAGRGEAFNALEGDGVDLLRSRIG